MNLLFCGNEGVFDGVLSLLISITNKTKEPVNCYVFTMNLTRINPKFSCITDEQIDFLNSILKYKNPNNSVLKFDVTNLYEKEFKKSPNENAYCTPYTLLRLLADEVPEIPDKILYLDIDMMAGSDISKLYNVDVSNYEYGAVREKYGSIFIRPDYINAGMLLLNIKKIKETKLLEKSRNLIKTKKMLFADQDAIFRSTTKKLLLPRIYNEQFKFNSKKTVICHFCKRLMLFPYPHTENYKQWQVSKIHKYLKCYAFDDDLYEYIFYKKLYDNQQMHMIFERRKRMKEPLQEIPIFFAVDDNYTPFLVVSIKSLIENSSDDYYYSIKILHTSISEEHKSSIKKLETNNVGIEFVDLNYYIEKIKDKLYTRDYYSKTTYFRLFIPNLYPQYNKALYLDSDIVILSDIANLYNVDMENNLVAAAPDEVIQNGKVFQDYAEKVVGVASYKNYFNAGVLLMNLDELKKIDFQNRFLHLLETIKFSVAQDQDYLNRLCKGRVKLLDGSWNKMPMFSSENPNEKLNLIHYNLAYKPWHFEDITYKDYFWSYAKQTEFFDEIQSIKDNYSDEEKFADRKTHEMLIELAKRESDCVGDDRRR